VFTAKRKIATVIGNARRFAPLPSPKGRRILMYHSVGNQVDGDINGIYTMSNSQFAQQVETIQQLANENNIAIVPFAAAHENSVSFTFDDGYIDALTIVAPLLCSKGIPFHVFVSSARMNRTDRKYMSISQVAELAAMPGATIGCHGAEHLSLTSLSITEATNDLRTSKLGVEAAVQHTIDTMSYPYGHVNDAVRAAAQQVGFTQAACSTWGFNTQDTDHMMLKRIDMWAGDNRSTVRDKVLGYWNWFGLLT
jgi:peptidoglycan/xylan/chitin deacetylase (PgdA/CDA1 family)